MVNGDVNSSQGSSSEEQARARRLNYARFAGRRAGNVARESAAQLGGKVVGKGTGKATEYGVRGAAAVGAGAVGLVTGPGAIAAAKAGWFGSAPVAKGAGAATGKAAELTTRGLIRRTGRKKGDKGLDDAVLGFFKRRLSSTFFSLTWPLWLAVIAGFLIFMFLLLVVLLMIPLGIL